MFLFLEERDCGHQVYSFPLKGQSLWIHVFNPPIPFPFFPRVSSRPLYTTDTESSIILFPNLSVSGRLKQSKTVDIEAIDSQLRSIDQSPDKLGENQAE